MAQQKLHKKDFQIAFKTGSEANKPKFAKECVQGELYLSDDALYIAENTAGANDSALTKYLPAFGEATVYNTEAALFNVVSPAGYVAYAQDTGRIYISNGSGWVYYNRDFINKHSLSFDGVDDYVDCGVISGLQGSSNGAISVWIKPDTAGDAPNIGYRPASDNQFVLTFVGGTLYFGVRNGSTANIYTTSAIPNDANWHNYVATFNSGTTKIYIDGSQVAGAQTGTNPSTISSTSGSFFIGRNGADNKYTDGLLDEAALFNTALSASDVTDIYNSGVPGDISSLSPLGWWRMGDNDGGTGTSITDQGSGGNNGTLTNGPTFSTDTP